MMWRAFLLLATTLLLLLSVLDSSAEAKGGTKRRKVLRRKVLVQPASSVPASAPEAEAEVEEQEEEVSLQPVAMEERNARGFLDQYYQQFDQRVQPSLERSDASSFDDDPLSAAASVSQDDVAADVEEVAARAKSFPDSLADGSANIYSQLSSPGLGAPTHSLPSSPYLRPVPLPAQQYSSGLSSLPSLGGAALGGLGGQPDSVVSFPSTLDSDYAPSLSSSSSSGDGTYKRTFSLPGHSSSSSGYGAPESNFIDDGYKEVPYTSKPLASKYFGVATTTSQDIQLGLTFTVPFLSIPLSGLSDILSGAGDSLGSVFGGLGGAGGGFDLSNLLLIGAVAFGAIFILPQVLYWLTGVNLSAFNWGRSDDPNYLNNLANTVDRALGEYDIDARQCAASVLCNEMKRRGRKLDSVQGAGAEKGKNSRSDGGEDEDGSGFGGSVTDMIGYGLIRSAAKSSYVKTFLGDARVKEVMDVAESGYQCQQVFSDSGCPWHPSTSKKIVAKLIMNSDLDLGTLANMAIQGAKAFS